MNLELRKYEEKDYSLLVKLLGNQKMTEFLGGPESKEKLQSRHQKYLTIDGCYVIEEILNKYSVGWIGNWEITKNNEQAWEIGFSVLPEFQGKGIATKAIGLILEKMRTEKRYRYVYAFPHVKNSPSNEVCRKTGFSLLGEEEGEYPKGRKIICNNWRYDLINS